MAEVFQASLATHGSHGLYRDDKLFVIDIENNRFPLICPRCGMATEESDRQQYMFRAKGLRAAIWGTMRHLPLEPCEVHFHTSCVPKFDTVPIWADAIARILFCLSVLIFIVAFEIPDAPRLVGTLLLLGILSLFAAVAAWFVLIIDLFVNFHPLRISKREPRNEFVWVKGAHSYFVNSLPPV